MPRAALPAAIEAERQVTTGIPHPTPVPLSTTPDDVVRAYTAAFESLDPAAISAFYAPPCLFISPGSAHAAPDPPAALAIASFLVQQAKAQGYRRSHIAGLSTALLGPDLATATGTFVRLDADDHELMRFGFLYVLRQVDGRWRISVAAAFPAPEEHAAHP